MSRKGSGKPRATGTVIFLGIALIAGFYVARSFNRIKIELFRFSAAARNMTMGTNRHACTLRRTHNIPDKSFLIIGHAYGSHQGSIRRHHEGVAPTIKSLIEENKSRISGLIFTGDVLSVPSEQKWRNLNQLTQPLPVYIAPGNHDVHTPNDNAFRDMFKNRITMQSNIYPQSIVHDSTLFILDDSTVKDSSKRLGLFIKNELKNRPTYKKVIVARHHVLPQNLKYAQNGVSPSGYWSENQFAMLRKAITDKVEIIFIYGDGGAFARLPRIACVSNSDFTNIVNGVGEIKGDRILVYSKGVLSYYII